MDAGGVVKKVTEKVVVYWDKYGLRPFLKKEYRNIKTGEEIDSMALRAVLDLEKVKHTTDEYGGIEYATYVCSYSCPY